MFWRLVLLEKDKVVGRRLLWIELGILTLLILIVDLFEYYVGAAVSNPTVLKTVEWPAGLISTVGIASSHSLGGILLVVVVAIVTAREYTWRTFHLWMSRGVSRLALMGAKSIITIAIAILLVLTAIIVGGIITAIITLAVGGSLQLPPADIQHLVLSFLATDLGLLPYAALTLMLTILFRNSIVSISVGIVLLLLVETTAYTILSFVNPTTKLIAEYLPYGLEGGLQSAASGSNPTANIFSYLPPLLCAILLFVYAAIFAGLGIWRFTRQNFTD